MTECTDQKIEYLNEIRKFYGEARSTPVESYSSPVLVITAQKAKIMTKNRGCISFWGLVGVPYRRVVNIRVVTAS